MVVDIDVRSRTFVRADYEPKLTEGVDNESVVRTFNELCRAGVIDRHVYLDNKIICCALTIGGGSNTTRLISSAYERRATAKSCIAHRPRNEKKVRGEAADGARVFSLV